jgi:hypothetical protein
MSVPAIGWDGKDRMSRVKMVLLSLLAVLAVSSVVSTTASAAHVFLIEQTELLSSEAVESQGQNGRIETKVLGVASLLQCQEELSSSAIKLKGESTFRIEFKNCYTVLNENGKRVFSPSCTTAEPLIAEGTDQLIEHGVDELKGELNKEKGVFAELMLTGEKCALKGKYKITGGLVCAIPETEFEKVLHHFICTPAGSRLVVGTGEKTEPAQYFGEQQFRLKSLKIWAAT